MLLARHSDFEFKDFFFTRIPLPSLSLLRSASVPFLLLDTLPLSRINVLLHCAGYRPIIPNTLLPQISCGLISPPVSHVGSPCCWAGPCVDSSLIFKSTPFFRVPPAGPFPQSRNRKSLFLVQITQVGPSGNVICETIVAPASSFRAAALTPHRTDARRGLHYVLAFPAAVVF